MGFKPTPHPVYPLQPDRETLLRLAEHGNCSAEEAWKRFHATREKLIAEEREFPLKRGWESPVWKVCDALFGFPWAKDAEKIRAALGFGKTIRMMLILGGNRSGKSEYAAKRTMLMLTHKLNARAWVFHTSQQMSVEYQQPLIHKYFPPEFRNTKAVMTATTYVAYKFKTGFSENSFTLPNRSWCSFRNYGQDIATIEGGEVDWIWNDENAPPEWVATQTLRLATREGCGVVTFTPVQGYTGIVKEFMDGAKPVREKRAWLCPVDGGEWALDEAMKCDTLEEILAETAEREGQIASRRKWETVPRIMRCANERKAVVFFHPSDNPFGNPREVADIVKGQPRWFVKERFYGLGNKLITTKFARFDEKVHVIDPAQVPAAGTNYQIVDPCSGRNWFMLYLRCCPEGVYCWQEWPGDYEIPMIGNPGPWAEPSGKAGQFDGRKGSAQKSFGFGLAAYKREIARLEGWLDEKGSELWNSAPPGGMSETAWIRSWDENGPARHRIFERYIDSRFANVKTFAGDETTTLLEELNDWGLTFLPTAAGERRDSINEGCEMINDALYFNSAAPLSYLNRPRLYISRACANLIFAMETWTGEDGKNGATKDPVDTLRYAFLKKLDWIDEAAQKCRGGGHY